MDYLDPWQVNRALSPEDLRGIVITLDQHLQALNGAISAACALSRQDALGFALRLNAEITDLRTTQALYHQMYHSAVAAGAQVAQIWRNAAQSAPAPYLRLRTIRGRYSAGPCRASSTPRRATASIAISLSASREAATAWNTPASGDSLFKAGCGEPHRVARTAQGSCS